MTQVYASVLFFLTAEATPELDCRQVILSADGADKTDLITMTVSESLRKHMSQTDSFYLTPLFRKFPASARSVMITNSGDYQNIRHLNIGLQYTCEVNKSVYTTPGLISSEPSRKITIAYVHSYIMEKRIIGNT